MSGNGELQLQAALHAFLTAVSGSAHSLSLVIVYPLVSQLFVFLERPQIWGEECPDTGLDIL